MRKEYFDFTGENDFVFNGIIWLPESEPKLVLQLTHGMTEHIGRYENLAQVLTDAGIVVAGFDLRGHGKNAIGTDCASFGKNGWDMMLKDMNRFHTELEIRFENYPHFLLGFSLGSFLARDYFSVYEDHNFSGAIIMGTGQQPKFVLSVIMGIVEKEIRKVGFDSTNEFIRNLSFGTYNKKFSPNRTTADWLCSDENQLDMYLADELCKKDISAGLFWQLLDSMKRTADKSTYNKWNKNMPVLLLSGSSDPVGDNGKGVATVEKSMLKAGFTNVKTNIYTYGRHDILHENNLNISQKVCEDIKSWLLNYCG